MAFDLTGINNVNEYYTNYYLTTLLEQDVKGVLEQWDSSVDKSTASPPQSELKKLSKEFTPIAGAMEKERYPASALELQDSFLLQFLQVLGYPVASQTMAVSSDITIPLFTCLNRTNGAPLLWVLSVLDEAGEDANPLDCSWQPFQVEGIEECSIEDFISDTIFTLDEPPRWIIVATLKQIVLVDRTKWHDKRLLHFNLSDIFARRETSTFQALAVLLHKESICPNDGIPLLDTLDENSHKHAHAVSEDLKYSLREAIEQLGNEVLFYFNSKEWREVEGITRYKKLYDSNIDEFARQLSIECLRYMYRLLFILYIEARQELGYAPMKSDEYRCGYSFDSLRDLEMVRLTTEESHNGFFIHESLNILFGLIFNGFPQGSTGTSQMYLSEEGTPQYHTFTIPPLTSHLFDPDQTPIIGKSKLRNHVLQNIIKLMSLSRPKGKRERRGRISYKQLGINQLGAVYEALLSYSGFLAKTDLYEVKKAEDTFDELQQAFFVKSEDLTKYNEDEKVFNDDGTLKKYIKGTFIYRLAGRSREKSASYYTPEVLTKCLVKYALKELLKDKSADEILHLTVCEPAMGSAAFLNEAVNQLAEAYLRKKQEETGNNISHDEYPQILQQVKMYIADGNVYGVDLNPIAVELGEVSLWLNTIHKGAYVPWFGMQLICGNSLVGARRQIFDASLLTSVKKGSETWLESVPDRVKPGEKRPEKGVYHFLLPDNGMADYNDPVIKQMAGPQINHIKNWRKEFTKHFLKSDIDLLITLSKSIDKLWLRHIEQLHKIRQRTEDVIPVWGQPPVEAQHAPSTTQWKDQVYREELLSKGVRNSSPYRRLKLVMDYWCALWFWPIDKAELLPSRDEFLMDLQLIIEGNVIDIMAGEAEQTSLFPSTQPKQESLKLVDEFGFVNVDELMAKIERLGVVSELAERYRFLHWELQFADLFEERGGFDLVVGNPPWIKLTWDESAVIGDLEPMFVIKKFDTTTIRNIREDCLSKTHNNINEYLTAYEESVSYQSFLGSLQNYPNLQGQKVNLYKCFIYSSWRYCAKIGICGLLHPEGPYEDATGYEFREILFKHLVSHYQFINELRLFTDVHHETKFSINIYDSKAKTSIQFKSISNLFIPASVDACFEHSGNGPVPGIKEEGKWNIRGHHNRIVTVTKDEIELFAKLYDDPIKNKLNARFPALHSIEFLNVLRKIAHSNRFVQDLASDVTSMVLWDETKSQREGLLKKTTLFSPTDKDLVVSGPHFYVSLPFYKTPRKKCLLNSDYDLIDLTTLPDNYRPRQNFEILLQRNVYISKIPVLKWDSTLSFLNQFQVANRRMFGVAAERSLICAILPPFSPGVNTVNSTVFSDINMLVLFTACCSSLPFDFLLKTTGKGDLYAETLMRFPLPYGRFEKLAKLRALRLNCLTKSYQDLIEQTWCSDMGKDSWCKNDKRCLQDFNLISSKWSYDFPLRNSFCRRQALVELDVLVSLAFNIDPEELNAIYRTQFPVLRQYENETFYDQNGRIIFTVNKSFSGVCLSRSEWEKVKNLKSGTVEQEIEDDTMPGGPIKRTIVYQAPFDKCDREQDYEIAWREFERRGVGKNV